MHSLENDASQQGSARDRELVDARCALTGVIIRNEPVVFLPLICIQAGHGRLIGLPRAGHYDGRGTFQQPRPCPVFGAFARSMVKRASFAGPPPPAEAFADRVADLSSDAPKLGMRQLGFAYALKSVYYAFAAIGQRDDEIDAKLRGKKRDATSLFDVAMFEGRTSRILHEHVEPEAEKSLRIGLVRLTRTGLGHRDLPRVTSADQRTYGAAERATALERAEAQWQEFPEVLAALSSIRA